MKFSAPRLLVHVASLALLAAQAACSSDDTAAGSSSPTASSGGTGGEGSTGGTTETGECTEPTAYAKNGDVQAIAASGARLAWVQHDLAGDTEKGVWVATLPGAPQHLTNATKYASSVVLDGDTVYWGDSEGLWSIPFAGGVPTRIAYDSADGVVVDADRIYWQGSSSFKSLPRGIVDTDGTKVTTHPSLGGKTNLVRGGFLYQMKKDQLVRVPTNALDTAPTVLASGRRELESFAIDADTIYAFDRQDDTTGDVVALPSGGGDVKTLAKGLLVPASPRVAVSGGKVYVTGLTALYEVPTGGGAARARFCTGGELGLAVAGSTLVWAQSITDGIATATVP